MAIAELKAVDFVVYSKSLYKQTISFDEEKWEKQYLPKLTFFYFEHFKKQDIGRKMKIGFIH